MIRFVKGTYACDTASGIVVETTSGIGFEIYVPTNSPLFSHTAGDELTVYTEMVVREDSMSLYGFHNKESLELFNLITTVSGIGPKGAMSILGSMSTGELKRAIAFGDVSSLSKANGVGKKTAERLVLELRDKIDIQAVNNDNTSDSIAKAVKNTEKSEAISALVSLGYSKQEAATQIAAITEEGLTSEEYIKKALKNNFR